METLDLSGEFTGRYLMVGRPGTGDATVKEINKSTGMKVRSSTDFENEDVSVKDLSEGDGIFFDKIGVAVINAKKAEQINSINEIALRSLDGSDDNEGVIIEPERVCRVIEENYNEYLRGYRDAVNHITDKVMNEPDSMDSENHSNDMDAAALDATYGLIKTKVVVGPIYRQPYTGNNIKVAVLDTGMDVSHPDFAGRVIISSSFVPNETVKDGHSHGTHCIGTACGPLKPTDTTKPRYGVAYKSKIYVGKVLNNAGSGADGWILAGINWAVAHKCQVISMSLGAAVSSSTYSAAYEAAAKAALNAGCLIIAAAGNDTNRPVSHPANCPSIMAVGAVNESLVKASFSNITFYPPHGKVDIVGPGVGTLSSVPMPTKYGYKSGTSMATPHVAGIAALWAERNSSYKGMALWNKLTTSALALSQPSTHVGSGLVQAPYLFKLIWNPDIILKPKKPVLLENGELATDGEMKSGKSKAKEKSH